MEEDCLMWAEDKSDCGSRMCVGGSDLFKYYAIRANQTSLCPACRMKSLCVI